MYPILFSIGNIHLYSYGLMLVLGFAVAYKLATARVQKLGHNPDLLRTILIISFISAYVGSHFLDVFMETLRTGHVPSGIWQISNGLTEMGGMLTANLGVYLFLKQRGEQPLSYLDNLALVLPLGLTFGRIGCLLAGCCYGKPTSLPWAITYTDPHSFAVPILGVPVHPTPVYMALAMLTLFAVLWQSAKRQPQPGTLLLQFWTGYAAIRFTQEFLRADTVNPGGGLTVYQWLCLAILVFVAPMAFRRKSDPSPSAP